MSFGSLEIRTYGVILAIAFLVSFFWAERRALRSGLDQKLANDVFFWAIIGAIAGARLGFDLQNPAYYWEHPAEILAFRSGGLSFHGGLVGALLAGVILLKQRRAFHQFWQLADAAAVPLLLGATIGRFGNWANQELYGYPTSLPWAITIDPTHRLSGYEAFSTFHPTFAYEALLNLVGLMILVFLIENGRLAKLFRNLAVGSWQLAVRANEITTNYELRTTNYAQPGKNFLIALAWYSLARFTTEIWRIGDRLIGPFSLAQLISIAAIGVVSAIYFHKRRVNSNNL